MTILNKVYEDDDDDADVSKSECSHSAIMLIQPSARNYANANIVPLATSGADSVWHGGTCPHFYKWLGTVGTVSRRTANKKLTKLY